jgi:transcriptional regulator GlxA family with amidase domain
MTFLLSSLSSEIGHPAYRVHIVAADEGTVTNSLGIATAAASLDDAVLDTLVVIGGRIDPLLSAGTLSRIVEASSRCRRVASVCTGAFILAAVGLLDGRRATTHWRQAARLQREYPAIRVEADRIFCRDGNVWTSAGITAGIDLALALIEEDHGFAIAKAVAQHLVVYHRRHGGQSQFAASVDLAPKNDRIAAALGYARDHIAGEPRRAIGGSGWHEPAPVQPDIPVANRQHTRTCRGTAPRRSGSRPHRDDGRTCRTHRRRRSALVPRKT